jgi:hypothetical protein
MIDFVNAHTRRAKAMLGIVGVDVHWEEITVAREDIIIYVAGIVESVIDKVQNEFRVCRSSGSVEWPSWSNSHERVYGSVVADDPWSGNCAHRSG